MRAISQTGTALLPTAMVACSGGLPSHRCPIDASTRGSRRTASTSRPRHRGARVSAAPCSRRRSTRQPGPPASGPSRPASSPRTLRASSCTNGAGSGSSAVANASASWQALRDTLLLERRRLGGTDVVGPLHDHHGRQPRRWESRGVPRVPRGEEYLDDFDAWRAQYSNPYKDLAPGTADGCATGTTRCATASRTPTVSSVKSSSRTPCRRSSPASSCSRRRRSPRTTNTGWRASPRAQPLVGRFSANDSPSGAPASARSS